MKALQRGAIAVLLAGLATACSTVREMEKVLVEDGRPPIDAARQESGGGDGGVAVPDLDERKEDLASLSQVDRLQRENRQLGEAVAKAEKTRDEAVAERERALASERTLIQENLDYQDLLKACKENEEKLKAQLLQAQIENVRLKQELASQRIRELSAGANSR